MAVHRLLTVGLVCLGLGVFVGCREQDKPKMAAPPAVPPPEWGCLVTTAEGLKWVPARPGGAAALVEPSAGDGVVPNCAISTDGLRLALVPANQSLVVLALVDMQRTPVGAPYAEALDQRGDMAWSPNGQTLAFVEEGKLAAWGKVGGRRWLDQAPRVTSIAWSPDGKTVAYGRRDKAEKDLGLWLLAASGGEPRRVAPPSGDIFAAAWPVFSPNGQWIAFWHSWEGGGLCFVKPDGSGYRKDLDFGGQPLVWRGDSSAVAYLSLKDEMTVRGIFQCTPSGKPMQLTGGNVDQFDMLPTGEAVWLRLAERKGDHTLSLGVYARAFDGISDIGWTRVLPGSHGQVKMLPDGRRVAVFIGTDEGPGKLYCGQWFGELQPMAEGVTELLGWAQGAAQTALPGGQP